MADKHTIEEFKKKLETDPKLKAEFSSKLTGVLKEMGVHDKDIHDLTSPKGHPSELVIVSRSDSKKNNRSIIIF